MHNLRTQGVAPSGKLNRVRYIIRRKPKFNEKLKLTGLAWYRKDRDTICGLAWILAPFRQQSNKQPIIFTIRQG